MRELSKHELDRISGGDDAALKDPPPVPDIRQTRTSGTTPDLGSLRHDKE
jgi:bacteriocin-like protein